MQSKNRMFDDMAKMASGAASTLTGLRDEANGLIRQQIERVMADMDMVSRDEFEAVKTMAANARAENEALKAKIEELEAEVKKGK